MLGRFNSLHRFKFVCCYSALKLERKLSLSSFDVMKYSFISFVVTKVLPETPSKCCFLVDPFVSSFNVPPFFFLYMCTDHFFQKPTGKKIVFLFVPLSQRSFFMLFFFFKFIINMFLAKSKSSIQRVERIHC